MMGPASLGLIRDSGDALHRAYVSGKPIPPISRQAPSMSLADAYRIQDQMLSHRLAAGARVIGKKIGATSEAVQKLVGIDCPDFGLLLSDSLCTEAEVIDYGRLIQPRAEGEIAFVLKDRLQGPGIGIADVLAATDHLLACIEVVDSRIENWDIRIQDTIADNASCGLFVLGAEKRSITQVDLTGCHMQMRRNGKVAAQGRGDASLGHPASAIAWLANTFGEMGIALEPGEPLLSGSLGPLVPIEPGDHIHLEIEGLGACRAQFGGPPGS